MSEIDRVKKCAALGIRFHADPEQVKVLAEELPKENGLRTTLELQSLRDQVAAMRTGGTMLRNTLEALRIAILEDDDVEEAERILKEFFGETK